MTREYSLAISKYLFTLNLQFMLLGLGWYFIRWVYLLSSTTYQRKNSGSGYLLFFFLFHFPTSMPPKLPSLPINALSPSSLYFVDFWIKTTHNLCPQPQRTYYRSLSVFNLKVNIESEPKILGFCLVLYLTEYNSVRVRGG